MTKGDKIKLRAELAGNAMIAIRQNGDTLQYLAENNEDDETMVDLVAWLAVKQADALMKELGLDGE